MTLAYTGASGKLSQATLQTFRVGAIEAPIVLQRQSGRGMRMRIVMSAPEELGLNTGGLLFTTSALPGKDGSALQK